MDVVELSAEVSSFIRRTIVCQKEGETSPPHPSKGRPKPQTPDDTGEGKVGQNPSCKTFDRLRIVSPPTPLNNSVYEGRHVQDASRQTHRGQSYLIFWKKLDP